LIGLARSIELFICCYNRWKIAGQERIADQPKRTGTVVGSIEIGASSVDTTSIGPLVTFDNVNAGRDAVVIEDGAVTPMSALGIASAGVHAVLDAPINTISTIKGTWLGI
jgi:hypothetical protein